MGRCGGIIKTLSSIFRVSNKWGGKIAEVPNFEIHCPICGYDYTHIRDIVHLSGEDSYGAKSGRWEGRGDLYRLHMYCEEGHNFWIGFGEHKGNVTMFIDFPDR